MTARRLIAVVVALLVAVQVIRNAAVFAFAEETPESAARVWPGHPNAEISSAMVQIGRAARLGKPAPPSVFASLTDAARKAPLAPEPFLVRGVEAQLAGNQALALRAFDAAERRDPRSLPAHFFLADALFRSGDSRRGLEEVGILARLAPNGLTSVGPYIAAYARDPRNWPQLRALFRSNREMETVSLMALAADASNANAVMALADPGRRGPDAVWLAPLLNSLVTAHQYAKAKAVWTNVSGARGPAGSLVYDATFSDPRPPAPFNWSLVSSTVGLAERQPGGGLHVIFYGHDDGVLARQLLLLAPVRYRVTMVASGAAADDRALNWSIRCDASQTPFSAAPVDVAASRGWSFTVPAACEAQLLELSGVSSDMPQQSEVSIRKFALAREAAGE